MAALTGPREYRREDYAFILPYACNSLTFKEGSMIGLRPSTGYAVLWDGTADDEFLGLAVASGASASTVMVDTRPVMIQGYRQATNGITGGVTVTGASAVTDNGTPVYSSTDNLMDLTLTPTDAGQVGEIQKWVESTRCWVRLLPKGYGSGGASGATDLELGDNLAAALDIKEGSNSYLKFVTTNTAERMLASKAISLLDATDLMLGTGEDALLRFSTGDASNHALVLGLDDTSQQFHITDKAAVATDWARSAGTHPEVAIHSNTTPATDYVRIGNHDGSAAMLDMVGGTSFSFRMDGISISTMYANGVQDNGAQSVTATTGGGTTGLIAAGAKNVTVTSDDANKQISLPAATVGDVINILVGATGCELISAVAAHKVNNVTVGATNELALVATSRYRCEYVAANQWIVRGFTNLGADEAALVPDAL